MSEDEDKSAARKLKARMKLAKTATMNQLDLAKLGLMKMTSKGNLYEPSTKGTITFEGYLFKKSPGGIPLMRHWHKRWFVLESPGKLLYFTDQAKTDLKGIIPLDMIERMLFRSTRLTLLMEATDDTPARKFSLKAETDTEIKTWGTAINKAFEELDRLEEEADEKVEPIGEGDAKYWKVETRKKLNLSVVLDDKSSKKKKGLKIDPRAKEIEADIAHREEEKKQAAAAAVDPPTNVTSGYMPLQDENVNVATSSEPPSTTTPERGETAERNEAERDEAAERQRQREQQEEADLAAAIAASHLDQRSVTLC